MPNTPQYVVDFTEDQELNFTEEQFLVFQENQPPEPFHPCIAVFYTVDPAGNAVPSVTLQYSLLVPPPGSGGAFDASRYRVTSDDSGLAQLFVQPGATYQLWSGVGTPNTGRVRPLTVTIPSNATTPYSLPNWVYRNRNGR